MPPYTAVITGASEGLGKSLALEMAGRGYNLVLVALPHTGLPQLSQFLMKNYDICVHYYEMDLTDMGNCTTLFESLGEKNIAADVLINNAGLGNIGRFNETSIAFYTKQITLNVMTPVLLTRLFVEQNKQAKKRYVLNVGSLGGVFIVPRKQVYGATKSFIRYFTRCLQAELQGSNISVSLLSPGGINTKPELLVLHQSLRGISRITILEPDAVARKAIDGMLKGKKEIIPGWLNRTFVRLNALLPSFIKEIIIHRNVKLV